MRNVTQIANSIIARVAIDVVYFVTGPLSMHYCPRNPVRPHMPII